MPTPTGSAASAVPGAPAGGELVSNALEDFTERGIGPEQADCRVVSCIYQTFDYQQPDLADDPPITVHMELEPIDGSNDGKNFEARWSTGQNKLSEFSVVNDGGHLSPTGHKKTLGLGTNWAQFLGSVKDCGISDLGTNLNSQSGIGWFKGMELTLRQVPQKERSGVDSKNAKGYARTMYTCLKVLALPGETKKGTAKKAPTATKTPAAAKPAAASSSSSSTNGSSAASGEVIDLIIAAATAAGGPIAITKEGLGKAVFMAAKAAGKAVADCQSYGKLASDVTFLTENATDDEFNARWEVAGDSLVLAG